MKAATSNSDIRSGDRKFSTSKISKNAESRDMLQSQHLSVPFGTLLVLDIVRSNQSLMSQLSSYFGINLAKLQERP
jgi:hypothetical protein